MVFTPMVMGAMFLPLAKVKVSFLRLVSWRRWRRSLEQWSSVLHDGVESSSQVMFDQPLNEPTLVDRPRREHDADLCATVIEFTVPQSVNLQITLDQWEMLPRNRNSTSVGFCLG